MDNLFKYLNETENLDRNFCFNRGKENSLIIFYSGYKNMVLSDITEVLVKEFKLKYDFSQGLEKFDRISGRTYTYFKNVYSND